MDTIVIAGVLLLAVPLALAIWLSTRAVSTKQHLDDLSSRLFALEMDIRRLRQERQAESTTPVPSVPGDQEEILAAPAAAPPPPRPWPQPEVLHSFPTELTEPTNPTPTPPEQTIPPVAFPPPLPQPVPRPRPKIKPPINWEQFMGVKGFAWLGGLALFLGVAFFVKYSFDNNLVPPQLRVAIGFITGLGLLVGGIVMSRRNLKVLAHTLCATGIVILYAVTFACRSVYHFDFFGVIPTFLLMVLITTTAFFVAVRLDAMVVTILGMLGGFLTPVLIATGQDNPAGLFGYLAILDAGLLVVALHRQWHFLTALAALGTALMQIGWAGKFFVSRKYFEGDKILIALAVLLGFGLLWLAANGWARRRGKINHWLAGSALGLVGVALVFTAWFLDFPPLAQRPWLIFGFALLLDLIALGITLLNPKLAAARSATGFAVFGLLAFWTANSLSNPLLNAALAFYFLFALLHTALPAWLQRWQGGTNPSWVSHLFPIFALALVLVPVFNLTELSFIVWPFILLVDLLAIALAVLTSCLLPVLAVLVLTLAATGALIFKIPADLTGLPTSFFLLGAFVVFFVVAGVWLLRRFMPGALQRGVDLSNDLNTPANLAAILPACSIVLPFLLLIMASLRLPLLNPTPLFGLALLLSVLLLGVTRLFQLDWMPLIGLTCVTALECAWHFHHFDPASLNQTLKMVLLWYLIFFAVFAIFPFLFYRRFGDRTLPWAAAALAGLPQFFLIHRFVAAVYPNQFMGLLPAAFALPGLLSLVVILQRTPAANSARLGQLAWFGGVALFFITLIFPIQFDRQWITIGWALEGVALLWLFQRVPHPGLRLTGVALLLAAFARLALNPAVLEYHPRAATPLFNWYLYAYGVVTLSLFAGTKLLAPPRHLVLKSNVPPILASLGTVLAFFLMNIEIADYFSAPGATLMFQFSGNFARDMTYSIAWAVFALVLLVYGIAQRRPAARYTAMALLGVTLLKLFFHDLAQLGQLYRIGAFIGVAVIAMLASFAYQKFFAVGELTKISPHEPPQ